MTDPIVPSSPSDRSRVALLVGVGVISFGVALVALLVLRPYRDASQLPTTGPAREEPMLLVGPLTHRETPVDGSANYARSDEPRCAANLQRVAAALQAWANRHDWTLPNQLTELAEAQFLDPAHLICPADAGASAGGRSYVYTGAGLRTPVRDDIVVAYEPARHLSGAALHALMGDGSVRLLTGADAARFLATAESKQRPLRIPPAGAEG